MRVRCLTTCTVGVAYFEADHIYAWPDDLPLVKHFERAADDAPILRQDELVVPEAPTPVIPMATLTPRPEYTGPLTMHGMAQQQGAELLISEADPRVPRGVV
jgi:hypothetical protein